MKTLYFGGGAWSSVFYLGVVKALEERFGKEYYKKFTFSGDSIGAFCAMLCSIGYGFENGKKLFIDFCETSKKKGILFGKMSDRLDEIFKVLDKNPEYYKILQKNKFKLGVSKFFNKYCIYTTWKNNEHLKEILHASTHVPFYCRLPKKIDNCFCFDGSFFLTNKALYDCDITIGKENYYDIVMNPTVKEIFLPPDKETIEKFIKEGYDKTINFDFDNIDKKKRRPIDNSLLYYIIINFSNILEIILNRLLKLLYLI